MNFLIELVGLLEKDTLGLDLGNFKLDTEKNVIIAKIGGKAYEFTPKDKYKGAAELFTSVTGIAKHSPGRALVYLKQHAAGKPCDQKLTESKDEDEIVSIAPSYTLGRDVTIFKGGRAAIAKTQKNTFHIFKKINKNGRR